MTINRAVKKALKNGKRIMRKHGMFKSTIEPTNTDECCIVHLPDGKKSISRWNPNAEDLMSNDWIVV